MRSAATADAGRVTMRRLRGVLGSYERWLPIDALHGVADGERAGGKVHILPAQPEQLALP
jgi:hypothetical protein